MSFKCCTSDIEVGCGIHTEEERECKGHVLVDCK